MRSEVPVAGSRSQRIARIAGLQRGRVSRHQLLAAAISSSAIGRLTTSQTLIPIHRGVYAVAHVAPTELAGETAALLALSRPALLSHDSAARLWGLRPAPSGQGPIHVLVDAAKTGRLRGVRIHRTRCLHPRDVRTRAGLPITSPSRTLLDIAPSLPDRELELAFDRGLTSGILRLRELGELLDRAQRRPGRARLAAVVQREGGPGVTRSDAEEGLLDLIRRAQLPEPRVNVRLHGYEVDFYWPEHHFVLEFDSYRFHSTRRAFENDRRKQAVLGAAGIATMRVTWRQFEAESYAVTARLAQALTWARAGES